MHALPPPCPYRRRDVLHRRNARLLEIHLEVEIEIGRVDADEKRRPVAEEMLAELSAYSDDLPVMPEHLYEAAYRELFHREENLHPRSFHLRTADADEAKSRPALAERTDQVSAKLIPGSFSRDDADRERARR